MLRVDPISLAVLVLLFISVAITVHDKIETERANGDSNPNSKLSRPTTSPGELSPNP